MQRNNHGLNQASNTLPFPLKQPCMSTRCLQQTATLDTQPVWLMWDLPSLTSQFTSLAMRVIVGNVVLGE